MLTRRVVHCEQREALALSTSQPSPHPSARAVALNLAMPHSSVVALRSCWSADLLQIAGAQRLSQWQSRHAERHAGLDLGGD